MREGRALLGRGVLGWLSAVSGMSPVVTEQLRASLVAPVGGGAASGMR